MSKEIEIGEYVRTRSGVIIKADFIDFNKLTISQKGLGYDFEDKEEMKEFIQREIKKHSFNIIDLIEEGDYINGVKIDELIERTESFICFRYVYYLDVNDVYTIRKENIKDILTKEQYEQNCYKVEE